jgi:Sulfotransferase family
MEIQRDHFLCRQLNDVEAHPIFIMGLPRSGTTWLYGTLTSLLPVASLSVYDIVHYGELLTAHRDGTAPALRKAIDARFNGTRTRGFDEILLSHATVDEYWIVLRRHAGRGLINARTLPMFKQLLRKLAFVQQRSHVLLKNPWDMGRGGFMATHLASARFIFLRRDPARILDSQIRMIDELATGENSLLALTTQGLRLENTIMSGARGMRRLVGGTAFRRLLVGLVEKGVYHETGLYYRSLASIPHARRIELSYEDLIADPAAALKPIVAFIGLPPERPLSTVIAKPRSRNLLPEVAARADRLRTSIGVATGG